MTLSARPTPRCGARLHAHDVGMTLAILGVVLATAPAFARPGPSFFSSGRHHPGHPAVQVLYAFAGGRDGALPSASLLTDASGSLYGTTQAGGVKNLGTVFKLTRAASTYTESVLHQFAGGKRDGALPVADLIEDPTGAIFGVTVEGGLQSENKQCRVAPGHVVYSGCGTVFKLTPTQSDGYTESIAYRFQGYPNGFWSFAGLIADDAGALYGTTTWGGSGDTGTIFKLSPLRDGYKQETIYEFPYSNGVPHEPEGYNPTASLLAGDSGAFYGTAEWGGGCPAQPIIGCGVAFKLTPSGSGYAFDLLYTFQAGADGSWPRAGLIEDAAGALYGTTEYGGPANQGTIFKLTPGASGYSETVLYAFTGGADGALPVAGLIADTRGDLYGTTPAGGALNRGTIFKLTPSGSGYVESVPYSFQGGADGAEPMAGLVACGTGTLCGTTLTGGTAGVGTVFAFTP